MRPSLPRDAFEAIRAVPVPLLRDAKHKAVLMWALTGRMPELPAGVTETEVSQLCRRYETIGDRMVGRCAHKLARLTALPGGSGGVSYRRTGPIVPFLAANETLALLCDALRSARVISGSDDWSVSNRRFADGFEVMLGALDADGRCTEAEAWFTQVRSHTLVCADRSRSANA